MRRNTSLMYRVLHWASTLPDVGASHAPEIPPFRPEEVAFHVSLGVDSGFLNGTDVTTMGSTHREYMVSGLTWSGHDVLDALEKELGPIGDLD